MGIGKELRLNALASMSDKEKRKIGKDIRDIERHKRVSLEEAIALYSKDTFFKDNLLSSDQLAECVNFYDSSN
jgi:hypothetical protein